MLFLYYIQYSIILFFLCRWRKLKILNYLMIVLNSNKVQQEAGSSSVKMKINSFFRILLD
jgi:hypothetical protein